MKINKKWVIIIVIVIAIVIGAIFYLMNMPSTKNNQSTFTVNNSIVTTKTNSGLGNYLADPNGNTLYTYNSDTTNVSNCISTCLSTWPAYIDTGSTTGLPTGFGTITRQDNGAIQYTYNGMPLYYFASDSNGQVTGNGQSNFKVAIPLSSAMTPSTTTPPSNTNTTQQNPSNTY